MKIIPMLFIVLMVLSTLIILIIPQSYRSEFLLIIPLLFAIGFFQTWSR